MSQGNSIVATVSAALTATGAVASVFQYLGGKAAVATIIARALRNGRPEDIKSAAGVVNTVGPVGGIALDELSRTLQQPQAARAASIRRKVSV